MFGWLSSHFRWKVDAAREAILGERVPVRMRVDGRLNLANSLSLRLLPASLTTREVDVSGCPNLASLPDRLSCERLTLQRTNIESLPSGLEVSRLIDARDCHRLREIPPLRVDELVLRGCWALEQLPEGIIARRLDISHCPRIAQLPASCAASVEHLNVSHCTALTELPGAFARLRTLDISDCPSLMELPLGIRIRSWIDIAGSGLTDLPWSLRSVRVQWRGVPISDRVAFDPDSITVEEILGERNVEVRRVLLERLGIERFVDRSHAEVLDSDRDAGGERRLLRIATQAGEDLAYVDVRCPSTGDRYILRVPPRMRTCREAAAWTAGFSDASQYRPAVET